MEKIITLVMEKDKSIRIMIDNQEKHIILVDDRKIGADKLYEIINFVAGTQYKVEFQNTYNIDAKVLEFFVQLISEIVEKVNVI